MAAISVSTESSNSTLTYRARAKGLEAVGDTIGQAIDGLPREVAEGGRLLVVVEPIGPDRFFTAEQQKRLVELRDKERSAHESGGTLTPDEQAELADLILAELRGATERSAELFRQSTT